MSSNPVRGEVYSIQQYVIKMCQWLATGRWFSPVSSTNKTDRRDIAEILLKVALITINQTIKQFDKTTKCQNEQKCCLAKCWYPNPCNHKSNYSIYLIHHTYMIYIPLHHACITASRNDHLIKIWKLMFDQFMLHVGTQGNQVLPVIGIKLTTKETKSYLSLELN